MSRETDTRLAVLKVLRGQSPGYAIFPNASAFVAEGLDPADVAPALAQLFREGKLEREMIPRGEPADNGETIPGGYRLKSEGGGDVYEETSEPEPGPEPSPTGGEPTPGEPTPDDPDE